VLELVEDGTRDRERASERLAAVGEAHVREVFEVARPDAERLAELADDRRNRGAGAEGPVDAGRAALGLAIAGGNAGD
jgi:hypothetical protein